MTSAPRRLSRADLWPVVLSREVLLGLLDTVTVCAVTSARRGVPTEVPLGTEHGRETRSTC